MQQLQINSSHQLLEKIFSNITEGAFCAETVYQLDKEIEKKMEQFDIEKRQKAAKAADDLSRLVITG